MNLYLFFAFILGTIVGSFLNVLILRLNTGKPIANARSQCFKCGKTLGWYELVPILSFLVQMGRCGGCKARISFQYISVEILTGLVFSLLYYQFGLSLIAFVNAFIFSILIAISVYDMRHTIIPDQLAYVFICTTLILNLFVYSPFSVEKLLTYDFLAGPIFFAFFASLWVISRGAWMGFGDAKLVLGIGWFLGLVQGFVALLLAFWLGAIVGIVLLLLKKGSFTIKYEIPFAPFLIIGMALAFFFNIDPWNFLVF